MKPSLNLLAKFGLASLLSLSSIDVAFSQADLAKNFVAKVTGAIEKMEKSCATEIKKYCSDVTPGGGHMVYCMQAHDDKMGPSCAYDLEDAVLNLQVAGDVLKDAVNACRADIAGVCGKIQPGQGRVAACLVENRTTVSPGCADAIKKVEAAAAK
jgi:Golgi apparatus protein 1